MLQHSDRSLQPPTNDFPKHTKLILILNHDTDDMLWPVRRYKWLLAFGTKQTTNKYSLPRKSFGKPSSRKLAQGVAPKERGLHQPCRSGIPPQLVWHRYDSHTHIYLHAFNVKVYHSQRINYPLCKSRLMKVWEQLVVLEPHNWTWDLTIRYINIFQIELESLNNVKLVSGNFISFGNSSLCTPTEIFLQTSMMATHIEVQRPCHYDAGPN